MTGPPLPLAVSMGDPAGIGLELIVRCFGERSAAPIPAFALVADGDAVGRALRRAGLPSKITVVPTPADAADCFDTTLPVVEMPLAVPETPGTPDSANAAAITGAIAAGVSHCLAGTAAGLVTLPIAKAALYQAGFAHPGHTEYLAALTADHPLPGPRGPVMMLATEGLRVALATIHVPLASAPAAASPAVVERVVRVVDAALRQDFGVPAPRIALCGLNPHAGEGGGIGREEIELYQPLAARLRAAGIALTDPQPADSLFHAEARATYDAAIALYHDQGLIPIKTLDFWGAVNITLGLPIVRTSPDHGTGFALAGRGVARPDSVRAALHQARAMADRRARIPA
jgi:4-hydroxythreonine-4-phosphate dehydrogenase